MTLTKASAVTVRVTLAVHFYNAMLQLIWMHQTRGHEQLCAADWGLLALAPYGSGVKNQHSLAQAG